jgi:hypothetical protein
MKLIDTTTLEPEAISILKDGTAGAPAPGDLWMLRLDGKDLGLVLLGYVQDTYVSALPVTLNSSIACIGAATVPAGVSPLNTELVVWATAPNSIGAHLLSHRIGTICSESDVRRLIHAADGEEVQPPFPLSFRALTDELFPEVEYVFNAFAGLADDEWVSRLPGEALFDTEILEGAELTPRTLGEWLDLPLSTALPLFHGDKLPTAGQVSAVSKRIGVATSDLLKPMHGYESVALSQPAFKKQVEQLGRQRRIGENAARNLALRDSYALAARQPNDNEMEMARQRAINSLDRLLREESDRL